VAVRGDAGGEAERIRGAAEEFLLEARREADGLRGAAEDALSDARAEADRLRADERTVADAREPAEHIRDTAARIGEGDDRFGHDAHRIRPDASPLDTDDEITAYAREERWHPGSAPHA
jgi:hypothetical protein